MYNLVALLVIAYNNSQESVNLNKKRELAIGIISLVLITAAITFSITAFIFSGNVLGMDLVKKDKRQEFDVDKVRQVKSLLDKYYLRGTDENYLLEGVLDGMTESLEDPYTVYLNKKEYEDLQTETRGTYAGIGIVVSADEQDNLITVVSPIEDTPGEKAGILPGDKIVKVDGKEVKGSELDKAVSMMKGPKGTKVTLTILRKDVKDHIEKTIIRDEIILKTIKDKILESNIGYIRISMFDEKTSHDFKESYNKLSGKGVKGLIIDVRDNPGGLLGEVIEIADYILPKGIIVYTEDKKKKRRNWYSDNNQVEVPIVLLINGSSASASEILAGALKDTGKGTLVGTKTFGKGVVQEVFDLDDGTAVKITVSEYFTPNGISIHGKGIQPDIEVKLPEKYKTSLQVKEGEDTQLSKAIEVIKSRIK